MEFENITNNERISKTSKEKKVTTDKPKIIIGNVTIEFKPDNEEDFDSIKTLDDLLAIDAKKPGIINRLIPPLYSSFRTGVDKTLRPYVREGDSVKYADKRYVPSYSDIDQILTVEKLELVALGSMSIFAARLSNGDHSVLTHFLTKV